MTTEIGVSVLATLVSVCTVLRRLENQGKLLMPPWLSMTANVLSVFPFPFIPGKSKPRKFIRSVPKPFEDNEPTKKTRRR